MRSIEDLAAEENARLWEERGGRFNGLLWFAAFGLGPWGWYLFSMGKMGQGSVLILGSFFMFLLASGVLRGSGPSLPALMAAFGTFLFSGTIYFLSRMPTFFWGKDPSFWTAVQEGTVVEPLWSPLSYLVGQTTVHLFGPGDMSLLPLASAAFLAAGLGCWAAESFHRSPKQNLQVWSITLLMGMVLAISTPFWNLGTLASGLPASLGFFLYLLLRGCLNRDEKPWLTVTFLAALLFSVHPIWGLLGILAVWGRQEVSETPVWKGLLCVVAGLTPYLWLFFRADKVFPSWGGKSPFRTLLFQWREVWTAHWAQDAPAWRSVLDWTGWSGGSILVGAILSLLGFGLLVKKGRSGMTPGNTFWVWVLSGLGGILFASRTTETLGPTFLWFLAEAAFFFDQGLEKAMGSLDQRSKKPLRGTLGALILFFGLIGAALWQGQGFWRSDFYFPAQHAENLLRTMGPRSLLICRDPFQNWACVATQRSLGLVTHSVILNEDYLGKKWFAAEAIEKEPEILFSRAGGEPKGNLDRFIRDNWGQWNLLLDEPFPIGKGLPSYSLGLVRLFVSDPSKGPDPEGVPARYDLVGLPKAGTIKDPWTQHYFGSYVEGFNQMGLDLMERGLYSEAIRSFDRALKLDPSFKEAQDHLAWLYSQKNMLEAAQLDFEATLKSHPARIAELLRELDDSRVSGREDRTVELLDRIIHLDAELANSQYQLSKIYDKEGRSKEAQDLLEASVVLNPKQLQAQLSLGKLMKKMGDKLRAREAFHAALVLDPLNKEAQVEYWRSLNDR
ncbi:MAG TPA: tetratricopeptide repeat protein [bacterium]|nr:tetratricopeptide repeat protein [bacterium]